MSTGKRCNKIPIGVKFANFRPEYKNFISDNLSKAVNDIINVKRKGRIPKYKFLLATYFSGCSVGEIERGITFQFRQVGDHSRVFINKRSFPIFDFSEGILYRPLFNFFLEDTYIFHVTKNEMMNAMRPLKKYIAKYITFNAPIGVHSIRQLRMYALIHDYGMDEKDVREMFDVKTWIFGRKDYSKALEQIVKVNSGIKLNPKEM